MLSCSKNFDHDSWSSRDQIRFGPDFCVSECRPQTRHKPEAYYLGSADPEQASLRLEGEKSLL